MMLDIYIFLPTENSFMPLFAWKKQFVALEGLLHAVNILCFLSGLLAGPVATE